MLNFIANSEVLLENQFLFLAKIGKLIQQKNGLSWVVKAFHLAIMGDIFLPRYDLHGRDIHGLVPLHWSLINVFRTETGVGGDTVTWSGERGTISDTSSYCVDLVFGLCLWVE